MRPMIWTQFALAVVISSLLASRALAQGEPTATPPPVERVITPPIPVAVDPPPLPPSPTLIWLERPTAGVFARYYPQDALDENVGGDVLGLPCGR